MSPDFEDRPGAIQGLRQQRTALALKWLHAAQSDLPDLYAGEKGKIHRQLLDSPLRMFAPTSDEQDFIRHRLHAATGRGGFGDSLNHRLATMLFFYPHQIAWDVDCHKLPQWLQLDYWRYLVTAPAGFQQPGEVEGYCCFFEELTHLLHRRLTEASRVSQWHKFAVLYLEEANLMPLYFSQKQLKEIYIKRAEIAEIIFRLGGYKLDDTISHGLAVRNKIRLGVLVKELAASAEIFASLPVFKHLPRDAFEIYLYVRQRHENDLEHNIRQLTNEFIVLPEDLKLSAEIIRQSRLDVLFFGNNMTAVSNDAFILASHRLAPIQCAHFCQPVTSGQHNLDYFILGDLILNSRSASDQFSEQLLRLDGSGICFDFSSNGCPPEYKIDRQQLGIDENCSVFISGANFYKIIPELIYLWATIVSRVAGSRLILYPFGPAWASSYPKYALCTNLEQIFLQHGISSERVLIFNRLSSRADIYGLLNLADLYLDAVPYSGATSLIDPLNVGLPPVVINGRSLRFCQGAALLRELGVPDLVAETENAYIELAIRLATDGQLRNLKRQEILQHMNNPPAFLDPASYARKIGRRLRDLVTLQT